MTISLTKRLDRIEARWGYSDDINRASDRQLLAIVRGGYAALRVEHGSLAEAARYLRTTDDEGNVALAVLIEEDIGGADARYH